MKARSLSSARCVEHGLALASDGRCALCRSSAWRARRSRWLIASVAAAVCALAGGVALWSSPWIEEVSAARAVSSVTRQPEPAARRRALAQRAGQPPAATGRHSAPDELHRAPNGATQADSRADGRERPAASNLPLDDSRLSSVEDGALGQAVRVPLAHRFPAPRVPDAPYAPIDPDAVPPTDDPRDFAVPTREAQRTPWSPPL